MNSNKTKMKTPPIYSAMLILMAMFLGLASYALAQGNNLTPKLYVVLQSSGSKCDKLNMERVDKDVVSKYASNPEVVFINYDTKTDFISSDTKAELDWFTVYQAVENNKHEEGITIIDPATKQVVKQVKLDANTADILKTINSNAILATIPPGR